MRGRGASAVAALLMLGACGGGSSGSAGPGVTIPPVTPTPTPTSTPTPPPTIAYSNALDLGRSWQIASEYAVVTVQRAYAPGLPRNLGPVQFANARLDQLRDAARYGYDPRTLAYALNVDGRAIAFAAADKEVVAPEGFVTRLFRINEKSTAMFRLALQSRSSAYFAFSQLQIYDSGLFESGAEVTRDLDYRFLLGDETQNGDRPLSGSALYAGVLEASSVSYDGSGLLYSEEARLSFDASNRRISGTIATAQGSWPTGTEQVRAALHFDGSYDPAGNILSGQITDDLGGFAGRFRGRLFGPTGREIGLIFAISRAGKGVVGTVSLVRN